MTDKCENCVWLSTECPRRCIAPKDERKRRECNMATIDMKLTSDYQHVIYQEFEKASKHYPKFASEHEGFAIIAEEMDELWDAVKLKQADPTRAAKCEKEAIQVAAMALRFLHDLHY